MHSLASRTPDAGPAIGGTPTLEGFGSLESLDTDRRSTKDQPLPTESSDAQSVDTLLPRIVTRQRHKHARYEPQ